MTVIAGIVGLRKDFVVEDEACQDLRRAMSRRAEEDIQEIRGARYYLAKFDIGALGSPGIHVDEAGAVSLLAGEPLLDAGGVRKRPRLEDLLDLHRGWRRGERSVLRSARGAFCLAQFDPGSQRLDLIADKLGLRSLYYCLGDGYLVFASTLRILECSRLVRKQMDVRGVAEIAAMRIALGDRTPYADVKLLKAGEILRFSEDGWAGERYWRWDTIGPASATAAELIGDAYRVFIDAVRLRLDGDRTALAFLSGGLDSRCIVTALNSAGANLLTYCIAVPGTLDQPLAARYADAIGSVHHDIWIPAGGECAPAREVLPLLDAAAAGPAAPERPRVVWSGEGGSGIVGCVAQTKELVEILRQGQVGTAAERYLALKRQLLPRRLFARPVAELLSDLPRRGVQERLSAFECPDPGRAISLFDLIDYQSRHLHEHYEDIDLTRVELETPFYDSEFVALMYSVPMDACLYHDFYHQWLAAFPPVTTSVPWQTYPGHLPCPLPLPEGFEDQWSQSRDGAWRMTRARRRLDQLDLMLPQHTFPSPLLDRASLSFARWTTKLGLGRYGYFLDEAAVFIKYWNTCRGEYVLPSCEGSNAWNPNHMRFTKLVG